MLRLARSSALALLVVLGGCFPRAGGIPEPLTPEQAKLATIRFPGQTESTLERGRQLFIDRCGACHNHPDLSSRTAAEWPRTVERMARKADLSSAEEESVRDFILVALSASVRSK